MTRQVFAQQQPTLFDGLSGQGPKMPGVSLSSKEVLKKLQAVPGKSKGIEYSYVTLPSTHQEVDGVRKQVEGLAEIAKKIVGIVQPAEDTETDTRRKDYSDQERMGVSSALKALRGRVTYPLSKISLLTFCVTKKIDALDSRASTALQVVYTTPGISDLMQSLAPNNEFIRRVCTVGDQKIDSWQKAAEFTAKTLQCQAQEVVLPLTKSKCKEFVLKHLDLLLVPSDAQQRYSFNAVAATAADAALQLAQSDDSPVCLLTYNGDAQKAELLGFLRQANDANVRTVVNPSEYARALKTGCPAVLLIPIEKFVERVELINSLQGNDASRRPCCVFTQPGKGSIHPTDLGLVNTPLFIRQKDQSV